MLLYTFVELNAHFVRDRFDRMSTMSEAKSVGPPSWVSKRSHLQVSKTEVLPIIFKSRMASSNPSSKGTCPMPHAFPRTEVYLSDSLIVVREWLEEHLERMYRVGFVNMKPGSLETPDVLRSNKHRFTVWFEPTSAAFAVVTPQCSEQRNENGARVEILDTENVASYSDFVPTPQTLHIVGELDNC